MKLIPTCTSFLFLVGVSSSLFFHWRRPTSANWSSAALSFSPLRLVVSAMYCFQSSCLDSGSLIHVTHRSIMRSHSLGLAPCLLMMLMDWAISQTRSLTLLSIHCVVKPPLSCSIPMVSAANWLTPTPAFSAQTQTCRVGICIVIASAATEFWQPEGFTLHFRFSTVVNDWVVDIECFLLQTSVRSIEYIVKGNAMW